MWLLYLTLSVSKSVGWSCAEGGNVNLALCIVARADSCPLLSPFSLISVLVTKQHPDYELTFSSFNFNLYNSSVISLSKRNLWISIIKKIAWAICNSLLQYFKYSPNKPKGNQTNASMRVSSVHFSDSYCGLWHELGLCLHFAQVPGGPFFLPCPSR